MCGGQAVLRTIAGFLFFVMGWCHAADPAASAPAQTQCPDLTGVRVDAVARAQGSAAAPASAPVVALRDAIRLNVSGLETLVRRARCKTEGREIVLFLDGRPVPTAVPYPPLDPGTNTLNFQLERKEASRSVWRHLLGRPSFTDRDVPVSVGLIDEYAVPSQQKIRLHVIPRHWFWAWTAILVLLLAAFVALATKSDVIRDTGPATGAVRKPYSLAKLQAAWWFFLILTSYLFIGLVTGDYNTSITSTVLSLMGISAATAVGSAVIDVGSGNSTPGTAAAPPAAPGVAGAALPAAAPATLPPVTRGRWWLDIVSDENGVNFHRFQMAAWTAVLGVIFVHDVYVSLAMPEFDNTLLGLLGISSGTYLGLKVTSER